MSQTGSEPDSSQTPGSMEQITAKVSRSQAGALGSRDNPVWAQGSSDPSLGELLMTCRRVPVLAHKFRETPGKQPSWFSPLRTQLCFLSPREGLGVGPEVNAMILSSSMASCLLSGVTVPHVLAIQSGHPKWSQPQQIHTSGEAGSPAWTWNVARAHLYPLLGQKVGGGVEHVGRMCGIVVGVRRMVIGFNNLEPGFQC